MIPSLKSHFKSRPALLADVTPAQPRQLVKRGTSAKSFAAGVAKGTQIIRGLLHKRLHVRLVAATFLLVNAVSSCTTKHDPYAGMEAARRMGQRECLAYSWQRKPQTAAYFKYGGHDWLYSPSVGSVIIDGRNPLDIPGSVWTPVQLPVNPVHFDDTACLPLAIAEAKQKGGRVVIARTNGCLHAYRIP